MKKSSLRLIPRRWLAPACALLLATTGLLSSAGAQAQQLYLADGPVYSWRPGAVNWRPVDPNATFFAGDAIYTGEGAAAELVIGRNDFLRMASLTQVSLLARDAGLLQFKVTSGTATFDFRGPVSAQIIQIETPNGSYSLSGTGYYRFDVTGSDTRFMTRRGGRATLTLSDGQTRSIRPDEQIVVSGSPREFDVYGQGLVSSDPWDQWNDARTEFFIGAGLGALLLESGPRRIVGDPFGRPGRPPAPRLDWHRPRYDGPPSGSSWRPRDEWRQPPQERPRFEQPARPREDWRQPPAQQERPRPPFDTNNDHRPIQQWPDQIAHPNRPQERPQDQRPPQSQGHESWPQPGPRGQANDPRPAPQQPSQPAFQPQPRLQPQPQPQPMAPAPAPAPSFQQPNRPAPPAARPGSLFGPNDPFGDH